MSNVYTIDCGRLSNTATFWKDTLAGSQNLRNTYKTTKEKVQKLIEWIHMVGDVSYRVYMKNGHDDVIYLNKPSHNQPSIWHDMLIICTLPTRTRYCGYPQAGLFRRWPVSNVIAVSVCTKEWNNDKCVIHNYWRKHLALGAPMDLTQRMDLYYLLLIGFKPEK